jgi:Na+-translocating ferredoxin:NAD+ oxidoreductase subunit C
MVPTGKKADCLIINGVECEPYLTSDHRLMLEKAEEMMIGVTILMKASKLKKHISALKTTSPMPSATCSASPKFQRN